ncbi:MAG: DegT/DnrJ/EryC1/StrS family aminotransferase [Bacteroidales bacterium]|nr:DegT/DnrJ/EryC1/StrS family aminotransferase [Bacteroidales bacterium]
MENLKMVDLKGQYEKIKNEIDIEINKVIESTAFINGSVVTDFTHDLETYLGVKHVIPCGNGTDALQVALMALGLEPGDEVISPDFTFVATVEAIALLGLNPRLVDVTPDTFTIDPEKIEQAITKKTKAIIPVHLYGQCANLEEIDSIATKYNLAIIEDTAQATGTDYIFKNGKKVKAGTIGDIGCTSFFPSKNLGAFGDGGALFTNNDELAEKITYIVNHGMKTRYYHDYVGVNSRLDSIQAAVLRVKLKYLDEYNMARQRVAKQYDEAFQSNDSISVPVKAAWSNHTYHQYTLKINNTNRNLIQEKLASKAIPSMIYYPVPIHNQKAYARREYLETDFEITNKLCKSVLSLPIHTEIDDKQINYIARNLIDIINNI